MSEEVRSVTVNLPLAVYSKAERVGADEGKSIDGLVREALEKYFRDREFEALLKYGERTATQEGIRPDDVERLIDEYRSER